MHWSKILYLAYLGIGTTMHPVEDGSVGVLWRELIPIPPKWSIPQESSTLLNQPQSVLLANRLPGRNRFPVDLQETMKLESSNPKASTFKCYFNWYYFIIQLNYYSSYQNGPDTYLLQLRDVDFPVRLREYMKVAANRGPGRSLIVSDDNGYDWRVRTIFIII